MARRQFIEMVCVLIVMLVLGGCSNAVQPAPTGKLSGQIRDAKTGTVPQGVRVTLSGKLVAVVSGSYMADALLPRIYELKVTAPGYQDYSTQVAIGVENISLHIKMQPIVAPPPPPPPSTTDPGFSAADIDLLARLVHAEAEGEPYIGKVAAAATVLNRVVSRDYPNTIPEVIYQVIDGRYVQYEPVLNGRINIPAGAEAKRATREAVGGSDPSLGAIGFYNPAKTTNAWVRSRPTTIVIGNHVFFK